MNIFRKLKNLFFSNALVLTNEVKKIDIKGLAKKSKIELEKIGRKIGIEFDRRFTKDNLIKFIIKQNKKL